MLYFKEQESNASLISRGIDPNSTKGAMISVKESFQETHELIRSMAKEEGIDLVISKKDKKEFEEFERKTDPSGHLLFKKAKALSVKIAKWLEDTPLISKENFDALEDLAWHHSLIFVKTARALRSQLESKIEKDPESSHDDSVKSGWVAYRSTKICKGAFEQLNCDTLNFKVDDYIRGCDNLMKLTEKEIIDVDR